MRSVYGRQFFQISSYSNRITRVDYLSRKIANSRNFPDRNRFRGEAEELVRKDEHEAEDKHGQRITEIFHDADFIINSNTESVDEQSYRFTELLFGSNSISPNKLEYGMYAAKSASLRSLDLSRQVGAAIFTENGEIISQGANEVPKAGGGTYWCDEISDDTSDTRDYKLGEDYNEKRKREILTELINIIAPDRPIKEIINDPLIKASQFLDALEYGRIIHAEMSAICDAARLGRSLANAVLFCTTFPCHMCAKHIVASGIKQVIFLEPYEKSLAHELHSDSIAIEGHSRGDYASKKGVTFTPFHGVSPRRYRDLFERRRRKDHDGQFQSYKNGIEKLNIDIKIPTYLSLELYIINAVLEPSLSRIGMQIAQLWSDPSSVGPPSVLDQ